MVGFLVRQLPLVSNADLVPYRRLVTRTAETRLPTVWGEFRCLAFRSLLDGETHVALMMGDISGDGVSVHVHQQCLAGDLFDTGSPLRQAMQHIAEVGAGVIVYLRSDPSDHVEPIGRQILADLGVKTTRRIPDRLLA
jgi:3,4-dihydroxy 2-butanone 4-phosphate synthase/GTP cyclohydrolase II